MAWMTNGSVAALVCGLLATPAALQAQRCQPDPRLEGARENYETALNEATDDGEPGELTRRALGVRPSGQIVVTWLGDGARCDRVRATVEALYGLWGPYRLPEAISVMDVGGEALILLFSTSSAPEWVYLSGDGATVRALATFGTYTGPIVNATQAELTAVRLTYMCGNRFRVRAALSGAVTMNWDVYGTAVKANLFIPARGAQASVDVFFDAQVRGTVRLFAFGRQVQVKANGGTACPSP